MSAPLGGVIAGCVQEDAADFGILWLLGEGNMLSVVGGAAGRCQVSILGLPYPGQVVGLLLGLLGGQEGIPLQLRSAASLGVAGIESGLLLLLPTSRLLPGAPEELSGNRKYLDSPL